MDIFKTPRDAAVAAQRNPVLWPGTDERFTGYGVMGLPFRSGHYLAMRHIPASSIGPEYRTRYRLEMGIALEMLEAPDLGNEDAGMPKEQSPGKPTTRRYSPEEKAAAVRMVRALRAELGTDHGTVQRVARQLGYGIESVRTWVRQADIDEGYAPGVTTAESQRIRDLEQENRELKRANEILKRAASFFGAELDRQHKK
jgi:transposase